LAIERNTVTFYGRVRRKKPSNKKTSKLVLQDLKRVLHGKRKNVRKDIVLFQKQIIKFLNAARRTPYYPETLRARA